VEMILILRKMKKTVTILIRTRMHLMSTESFLINAILSAPIAVCVIISLVDASATRVVGARTVPRYQMQGLILSS